VTAKKKQEEFSFDPDAAPAVEAPPRQRPPAAPPPPGRAYPIQKNPGPLQRLVDRNFLEYASYVIRDRAIPALADGLKPVQRRILHALHDMDDGRFIKVANVVGHTMQYHPHGDASIGDALVTLTNKGYLIEGQGNFGNLLTGDRAAAPRYIECRLTELARNEIFNKDLTEFVPSYDGRNREPVALPSKLPLLLMLGAEGIAVGLSTRILPYNFRELLEAQVAILKKKPFDIYPDFPQGGLMDVSAFDKGRGAVRLRARIERRKNGTLCITALPFGATTDSLTASIEDAVRKKKVPVKAITDFTSEHAEIELTLRPDANPKKAMEALYAFTQCEMSLTAHIVVIHEGKPVEMNADDVLRENTQQLVRTLKKELQFRKRQLLDDLHAKTLSQIFIENRIYKKIEACKTYSDVLQAVKDGLAPFRDRLRRDVTQKDIEMLLGIRIRRISLFDIGKNRKEIDAILLELDKVEKSLGDLTAHAVRYLNGLLKKYGEQYARRTEITRFETIEVKELTARELAIRLDPQSGYLGYGVEGDVLLEVSSYDKLVIVWGDGRYRVMPPPEKLFVDKTMIYCAKEDRERVMTLVYSQDSFTYIKRFTFGGSIMNRDYRCTLEDSEVRVLEEGTPEEVFVRYKKFKGQRIFQQVFRPGEVPIKGVKARGNQMTVKAIDRISVNKPRWWKQNQKSPRGVVM